MASTQEEAFREIQLSGKQLVFVAMAGLVIAVVIFLFGVQVGRGVLAQRGLPEAADAVSPPDEPPLASAPASQPSSGAPVTAGEKLSYAERLASPEPAAEQLKKPGAPAPAPVAVTPTPKPDSPAEKAPTRATSAAPAPTAAAPAPAPAAAAPSGTGFAIQVAALQKREEADVIVKRLVGKGYPAYVVVPVQGAPNMYRVRVGKFKERREADTVAARLQKEEQFKPWVVR